MKKLLFLLFLIKFITNIHGQVINIDSSKIVSIDKKIKVYSKEDSLKKFYKIIPRTATLRSLMVPGWGQVYNRQYWKLPLVAGAFAVNIYFIVQNNNKYLYYREQLKGAMDANVTTKTVYLYDTKDDTDLTKRVSRDYSQDQLSNIVSGYRKNRDGSYLILFAVWAANIVDANVTAHLKTFDMTDDISLKIQPSFSSPDIMEPVFGAKLILTIK